MVSWMDSVPMSMRPIAFLATRNISRAGKVNWIGIKQHGSHDPFGNTLSFRGTEAPTLGSGRPATLHSWESTSTRNPWCKNKKCMGYYPNQKYMAVYLPTFYQNMTPFSIVNTWNLFAIRVHRPEYVRTSLCSSLCSYLCKAQLTAVCQKK